MIERTVEYQHEGTTLAGLLCHSAKTVGPRPAVLVAHAWAGRSPFEDAKARLLAELGYVGFALDVYGQGVLGDSAETNLGLMTPFLQDRARLQSRLQAALTALRAQPEVDSTRVAAIGYCFGGLCVLDLARSGTTLRGVVSFHGALGRPGNIQSAPITAKVLVLHGHDDPLVPMDNVLAIQTELSQAGADWQLHSYGKTLHSFTNPEANEPALGLQYNAQADRRSWASARDFLAEVLA